MDKPRKSFTEALHLPDRKIHVFPISSCIVYKQQLAVLQNFSRLDLVAL